MAVALVQNTSSMADGGFGGGTTQTHAFGAASTASNTILAFASCGGNQTAATLTCTDDKSGGSNSYTLVKQFYVTNVDYTLMLFQADNAGAATNVTVNYGGATVLNRTLGLAEFSGVATGAIDVSTAGKRFVGSATITDDSMTTTAAGDLIITVAGGDNVVTAAGSGNALLGVAASSNPGWEYQVQTSAGAIANSIVTSASSQCGIFTVAFFAGGGGGGGGNPIPDLVTAFR